MARMPNMVANIVTSALATAPDVTVANYVKDIGELDAELRATAADAVIVHDNRAGDRTEIERLLRRFPALRVVTIDASGRSGLLHQLRLCSVSLDDLSGDLLQRALRGDAGAAGI